MSKEDLSNQLVTPLFEQIVEIERTAREFGFYWEHIQQLMDQIKSECQEIQEAWQKEDLIHLQEEIGDLMLAAVSLAIFCEADPHAVLFASINKFKSRYNKLIELAKKDGYADLKNQPTEVLSDYWNRAKKRY